MAKAEEAQVILKSVALRELVNGGWLITIFVGISVIMSFVELCEVYGATTISLQIMKEPETFLVRVNYLFILRSVRPHLTLFFRCQRPVC
jgi:hypothetical protein